MPAHVRLTRPHRRTSTAHRRTQPVVAVREIARAGVTPPAAARLPASGFSSPADGIRVDPYLDYNRSLTNEGGILITYKDIDQRLRHVVRRFLIWAVILGLECRYIFLYSPVHSPWINGACLLAAAVVNWLILFKPIEVYRQIEIRPDCLIIDGTDIFWRAHMDGGWPTFQTDDDGNQVLGGIYGTRFVEYLTVRRFDEQDRAPEIFTAHLQHAMQQLWTKPSGI